MKRCSSLLIASVIFLTLLFITTVNETAHAKKLWGKPPELKITGLVNGQTTTESTHNLNVSTVEKATVTVTLNDEIVEDKDNTYEIKFTKEGKNFIYVSSTLNGKKSKEQIEVYFKPKKVTNRAELQVYLRENYSVLQTKLQKVNFDIHVYENDSLFDVYDYRIELGTRFSSFIGDMNQHLYLNKNDTAAEEDVELSKKQLKDFIERLARDIIDKFPDKKILGRNDESYYGYPNLKLDYNNILYLHWSNYEPIYMKNTWPGDVPKDYSSVIYNPWEDHTSPIYRKYIQDARQRDQYKWEYQRLGYNDFRISDFHWLPFLNHLYDNDLGI